MQVPDDDLKRLLVHSMAQGMRDVDMIYLFPTGCPAIQEIARDPPGARKAVVAFASAADAASAFQLLPGRDSADSLGRAQKVVKVPAGQFEGSSVRVRVLHNAVLPKRAASPVSSNGSKRKR